MMRNTKHTYHAWVHERMLLEPCFRGYLPTRPALVRGANSEISRIGWALSYIACCLAFALQRAFLLLLPVHFLMDPTRGGIVYGCRNFATRDDVTPGRAVSNRPPSPPRFAQRPFAWDPSHLFLRTLALFGMTDLTAKGQLANEECWNLRMFRTLLPSRPARFSV